MFETFPKLEVPGDDSSFIDKVLQHLLPRQGGNQCSMDFEIEAMDVIRLHKTRIGWSELEDEHLEVVGVFTDGVSPWSMSRMRWMISSTLWVTRNWSLKAWRKSLRAGGGLTFA